MQLQINVLVLLNMNEIFNCNYMQVRTCLSTN